MKFVIATILLAACAAVQGRSVQVHPIISMQDYRMGLDTRIIDGANATKGQFPWQAALLATRMSGTFLCSGSLISDRWVLTAAHCVTGAFHIEVHLGGVNLFSDMEYKQTTRTFLHHENYNSTSLENDVALVLLPVPATLSANVQIIPLAARSQSVPDESSVTASGYGKTLTGGHSEILQWVNLLATTNEICSQFFSYVFSSTLCAHGTPHHSPCSGDSGGPLVQYNPDAVQVGVVSFASGGGCDIGYPSAYARVSSFLDWINHYTGIPVRE